MRCRPVSSLSRVTEWSTKERSMTSLVLTDVRSLGVRHNCLVPGNGRKDPDTSSSSSSSVSSKTKTVHWEHERTVIELRYLRKNTKTKTNLNVESLFNINLYTGVIMWDVGQYLRTTEKVPTCNRYEERHFQIQILNLFIHVETAEVVVVWRQVSAELQTSFFS
ncbi:hypothetical protein CPB85DRAFT_1249088 [Mucidula mucida]|nr:hypothetical protein CPB85DRAFT_1249088 [Mucidula mucida]